MGRPRIPPPVYALALALGLWWLVRWLPMLRLIPTPWRQLGALSMAAGLTVDVLAVRAFRRHRTTVNPLHPERASSVVDSGPYAYSRNPMYLGMLLVLAGWSWLLGAPAGEILVAAFAILLTEVQIKPEEQALAAKFGPAFERYRARVGRWAGRRPSPRP